MFYSLPTITVQDFGTIMTKNSLDPNVYCGSKSPRYILSVGPERFQDTVPRSPGTTTPTTALGVVSHSTHVWYRIVECMY